MTDLHSLRCSWNEMVAQPQAGAFGRAMGLAKDPTIGDSGFVGGHQCVAETAEEKQS